MLFDYLEEIDTDQPGGAGFSIDGGRAVATYLVNTPDPEDDVSLRDAITEIIGTTSTDVGDGRLQRTPPLAHPLWPWLTANAITNIRGKGKGQLLDADDTLEVPTFPQYWLYPQYEITVEFKQQQYCIATDDKINKTEGQTWYDETGASHTYTSAPEWTRYTTYEFIPQNDSVTAQIGNMIFASGPVSGRGFVSPIKQFMPNGIVKFMWRQVPFRYVESSNSYLNRWRGYINQQSWYGWPKGSLLYVNYTPRMYTPPVPEEDQFAPGVFSTEKLCDIEFIFMYTSRNTTDTISAPSNKNFVTAGWNLLPSLNTDRLFHYALTKPNPSLSISQTPSWYSAPFDELFYDPDATGGL